MYNIFKPLKKPFEFVPIHVLIILIGICAFSIGGVISLKTADAAQQDRTIISNGHTIFYDVTKVFTYDTFSFTSYSERTLCYETSTPIRRSQSYWQSPRFHRRE